MGGTEHTKAISVYKSVKDLWGYSNHYDDAGKNGENEKMILSCWGESRHDE